MKRIAKAHWKGNLQEGKGEISTQSTVLNNTNYSFKTRFADGIGTNPEELIAAAHAGCFTMAVSATLTQAGITANDLDTEAVLDLDLQNLKYFAENIAYLDEVSIGHALISDALYYGLENTIQMYLKQLK